MKTLFGRPPEGPPEFLRLLRRIPHLHFRLDVAEIALLLDALHVFPVAQTLDAPDPALPCGSEQPPEGARMGVLGCVLGRLKRTVRAAETPHLGASEPANTCWSIINSRPPNCSGIFLWCFGKGHRQRKAGAGRRQPTPAAEGAQQIWRGRPVPPWPVGQDRRRCRRCALGGHCARSAAGAPSDAGGRDGYKSDVNLRVGEGGGEGGRLR